MPCFYAARIFPLESTVFPSVKSLAHSLIHKRCAERFSALGESPQLVILCNSLESGDPISGDPSDQLTPCWHPADSYTLGAFIYASLF
jgi:hypothetical protein